VSFALFMGLAGLVFFYIGVSMGWLYEFMGVLLGSAVVPIALCVTWKKANKNACIWASIIGLAAGVIAWLVTTSTLNDHKINVLTTFGDYEMLAGNLAAIGVGGIIATVWSYIQPADFDFELTRAINAPVTHHRKHVFDEDHKEAAVEEKTKEADAASEEVPVGVTEDEDLDPVALEKAFKFAAWSSIALTVISIIIIPLPLFFAHTIYGKGGLTAWVTIGIIWAFLASFIVVLYPLYESRVAIIQVSKGVVKDIFARGSGKYVSPPPKVEDKA